MRGNHLRPGTTCSPSISGQLRPGEYTPAGGRVLPVHLRDALRPCPCWGERPSPSPAPGVRGLCEPLTLRAWPSSGWFRRLRNRAGGWPPALPPGPSRVQVEGLVPPPPGCAPLGRWGESVTVKGMDPASLQGDKAVCDVLAQMGARLHITGDRVTAFHGPLRPTDRRPGHPRPGPGLGWPPWPPPFPAPPPSPGRPGCG